jgi:hypothetical protein
MNQYRCETCNNKEPIPTPRWANNTPLHLGERCKITKQKCKKKFTSAIGCASHSDFQNQRGAWCGDCGFKESDTCNDKTTWKRCRLMSSEPEGKNVESRLELARKSERERVLEEIISWRKKQDTGKCYENSDWFDLWLEEGEFIEELRGEQ